MSSSPTSAEVSLCQGLQDGVHGSHVEDEAKLGHTHGDEAQQEDGTKDALHEGLSCRGNRREVEVYYFLDYGGFTFCLVSVSKLWKSSPSNQVKSTVKMERGNIRALLWVPW